ncbi:MAG TPA: hypothetical protein VGO76_14610 [Luteibacter sp.]|jgi:hypothetical protein|nr:hypothetical protein [Luteibacter sp.]
MNELQKQAGAAGQSVSDPSRDITPFLMVPLDPGADNRGYVSKGTRRGIERKIGSTTQTFSSLEESNLPKPALALRKEAQSGGKTFLHKSSRNRVDGFRRGDDVTYTESVQHTGAEKRKGSDTPAPRSPPPSDAEALWPDLRYEQAHQSAFQFTRLPGTTVHAPTQANQVADASMERFVKDADDGFIYRHDTFTHSELFAARKVDDKWETQSTTFRRRRSPARAPDVEPERGRSRERSTDTRRDRSSSDSRSLSPASDRSRSRSRSPDRHEK